MSEVQIFNNEEFGQIRTVEVDGEPWLVGKDVARALGYQNPSKAIADHIDPEDKLNNDSLLSLGQRGGWLINESGLYSLVLSSKLPGAKRFKRWVTSEVLPSVRRHGAYMTPEVIEKAILNPDFVMKLAQTLKEEQLRRREAEYNMHLLDLDNRRLRPKADYFDALVDKNMLTSLRETAKLFHVKERRLIRFLLDNRFLYRSPSGKLLPYATRPANGLFAVKETKDDRTGWVGVQTFVTPRGRETFRLLLEGRPESELWGPPLGEVEEM